MLNRLGSTTIPISINNRTTSARGLNNSLRLRDINNLIRQILRLKPSRERLSDRKSVHTIHHYNHRSIGQIANQPYRSQERLSIVRSRTNRNNYQIRTLNNVLQPRVNPTRRQPAGGEDGRRGEATLRRGPVSVGFQVQPGPRPKSLGGGVPGDGAWRSV